MEPFARADPLKMRKTAVVLALSALASVASAADFSPAIVYDFGGKFDQSFNQSASVGVERFKKETGIPRARVRDPERVAAGAGHAGSSPGGATPA